MKKIPVLDSIRYAYAFTFGHLGTIIGLIWVPMVILAVAGYFIMSYYYNSVPAAVSAGDAIAAARAGMLLIGWSLASLLLSAIMYVAVTRQALGLREGPAVVHFALGLPEFRVFGTLLGIFALALFFLMLDVGLIGGVAALAAKVPAANAAVGLFGLGALFAIVYALIRLSFLAIPATVAEGKVGLARAWELSSGNFWRIVAVGLATLGPIVLIALTAEVAVLGPGFFLHNTAIPTNDTAQQMHDMAEQMRTASEHLPALYGFSFLMAPFFIGLGLAPAAFAYRALTGGKAADSAFRGER